MTKPKQIFSAQSVKNTFAFIFITLLFFTLFSFPLPALEQLVSNVDGKIQVLILHYGGESRFWFDETVLFRELLEKMDKDVGFVILYGTDKHAVKIIDKMSGYASQVLPDGTPRVKFLQIDAKTSDFYPWARDAYLILADENRNLVFQDCGFNRPPFPITNFDDVFAEARTRAGILHLGGGNIRATDDEIFLGIDTIMGENITPSGKGYNVNETTIYSSVKNFSGNKIDSFRKRFQAHALRFHHMLAPGKKLVIPADLFLFTRMEKGEFKINKDYVWHTGAQSAYHMDVYLGVGHRGKNGKRVLFIADSNQAADIVEKMTSAQRRAVEEKFPDILVEEGLSFEKIPLTREQIRQRFQWQEEKLLDLGIKPSREAGKSLDALSQHLESQGYTVIRIPSLNNGMLYDVNQNDGERGIAFNYSNVLLEVYGDVKRVYIPQFGFKELDEAAAKAYRNAGYEVIFIKGLLTNAFTPMEDGAGLDCMTSEIRFPVRWNKKYYQ